MPTAVAISPNEMSADPNSSISSWAAWRISRRVSSLCSAMVSARMRGMCPGYNRFRSETAAGSAPRRPVPLHLERWQRVAAEDQVGGLLGDHHDRRVDVGVGDV